MQSLGILEQHKCETTQTISCITPVFNCSSFNNVCSCRVWVGNSGSPPQLRLSHSCTSSGTGIVQRSQCSDYDRIKASKFSNSFGVHINLFVDKWYNLDRNRALVSANKKPELALVDHLTAVKPIEFKEGNSFWHTVDEDCISKRVFETSSGIQDPFADKTPVSVADGFLLNVDVQTGLENPNVLNYDYVTCIVNKWKTCIPSLENAIETLLKCRKTKNLVYARSVYLILCCNGLSTHKAVENYIVPMFVESGGISEAQLVFNKLSFPKEHSWTSLMLGHVEYGDANRALYLHKMMLECKVNPSVYSIAAVLKACTQLHDIENGWKLHSEVVQYGFENDNLVLYSLIHMYSECGNLSEALIIFKEMSVKDASSWTALIAGYVEHGAYSDALKLFVEMKSEGVVPISMTYVCGLKVGGCISDIDMAHKIHIELTLRGLETDPVIGCSLVRVYSKCALCQEAQEVFNVLSDRDTVAWNALIAGYTEHGASHEALACYRRMQLEGIHPDSVTYTSFVKACGNLGNIDLGKEIHFQIVLIGIDRNLPIFNSLVSMYSNCGYLLEAQKTFNDMTVHDVVSWASLAAGYAEYGHDEKVLSCVESMKLSGILPDAEMYACSLKACSEMGFIYKGQVTHKEIVLRGCEDELPISRTLVCMYSKLGLLLEANALLNKLMARDVVVWTAIITGYVEYGHYEEALECFDCMQLEAVLPNVITYIEVMKACWLIGGINFGHELHMEIIMKGFEFDGLIGNALISMYANCGSVIEAHEVFSILPVKDVVSWNAIIGGLIENDLNQEALDIFSEMQDKGILPDTVTFTSIAKACGKVGAIHKGREIHMKAMENEHNIEYSLANTLINMYANCGSLMEAEEIFSKLRVRGVMAWSSMIKAYGINHDGKMAIQCFEDMQTNNVKPDDVTFSCLLLACSHAGLVYEGQRYFKLMREHYGIIPTMEHYTCVVDLLARAGYLYEAENFVMTWCLPYEGTWSALLSGCKTYGETELGVRCFQQLVDKDPQVAAWYVPMADIYATGAKSDNLKRVEELRKHVGADKKAAFALIEVNKKVYKFRVGDNSSIEMQSLLNRLNSVVKEEGHLPNLDLTLNSSSDYCKEEALCHHAEKLALAFGILNTNSGATLRVTKNLRMCSDCHSTTKILSKVERREIILRDDCCVHHFKDGECSCGDAF